MVTDNGVEIKQWSNDLNCQSFAKHFVTVGLGLHWPEQIAVNTAGILPEIVDVGSLDTIFNYTGDGQWQ